MIVFHQHQPRDTRILAIFLIASMLLLFLPAPRPAAAVATGIFGGIKKGQATAETLAAAKAAAALVQTAAKYAIIATKACDAALLAQVDPSLTTVPVSDLKNFIVNFESCIQDALQSQALFVIEGTQAIALPYTVRGVVNTETLAQKQTIINILARIAISALIRSFTNQLIGWIQNDGGSNVGFVSDLTGQLRREADLEAGNFLNNLTGVNLCGDIGAQLRISLTAPGQLAQKLGCTLSDIGANAQSFFQDFSEGGWPAFLKIGLEPQNNPYGAYLIALDAKVAAEASARDGLLQRFLAGQGFQGTLDKKKRCRPVVPQGPGDAVGEECHYETVIKLPGSAAARLLPEAFKSDLNYLYAAREIDDAIIAVANALVGKVISSAVSFSRGDDGETETGQGIFSEELSNIIPFEEGLSGNSVEQQVQKAIFSADAALAKTSQNILAAQQNLFIAYRKEQRNTGDLEKRLNAELGMQKDLITNQTELFEIKHTLITATASEIIVNAGSQFTAAQSRLNQIIGQIQNLPPTAAAVGDRKQDTETELRNAVTQISSMTSLLREMQTEVKRLANQEASTTPQRKIELDAKSKEIDAEVIRLGESRTAIAGALSALVRATASATITAAVDNAITEMISSQREIQRANALMVSIVPLLKPE